MQVRVKILQGSNTGKEVKIPMPKCLIGRGDECNLRPQADAISRRHCVIITTEHEVTIRDLNSRNGTYVNGERVSEDAVLLSGDILRVGPLEFEMIIEQTASKIKRPRVTDIKQAAARAAEGSTIAATAELGDVTQWLEEAEEIEKRRRPDAETRMFHMEDTQTREKTEGVPVGGSSSSDTKALPPETKRPDKKTPGKLPPRPDQQSKDSREAAADMLKKFFNRR